MAPWLKKLSISIKIYIVKPLWFGPFLNCLYSLGAFSSITLRYRDKPDACIYSSVTLVLYRPSVLFDCAKVYVPPLGFFVALLYGAVAYYVVVRWICLSFV